MKNLDGLTLQEEPVKFWCLQALLAAIDSGRYAALEPGQRDAVKQALMGWMQGSAGTAEAYVKNKFASLLVELYLTGDWPSFFHDLIAAVPRGHHVADVVLRPLRGVSLPLGIRRKAACSVDD